MKIELFISVIGAIVAIVVSILGAILANKNSIILQTRKLKEEHYVCFLESLHNLASDNSKVEYLQKYTFARDKLLLIANEQVIDKLFEYENNLNNEHDKYLTELIKAIRKDLKLGNRNLPILFLKKS
jgi:hypothetical protein